MFEEQLKPWPWDKTGENGYTITIGITKKQADIIKGLSETTGTTPAGIISSMIATMCIYEDKLENHYNLNHDEEE